jgi:hypothetical protein
MAVLNDLQTLAAQDASYLSAPWGVGGITLVLQGRLRQSVTGHWVFSTSLGQSGVVGLDLGTLNANWTSAETPATGLQIQVIQGQVQMTLSALLPPVFTE